MQAGGQRLTLAVAACALGAWWAGAGARAAVSARSQATHIDAAGSALMLSLARQDGVVLAVGERGIIERSGDGGAHWQAVGAPTQATLARVIFTGPAEAYATGFDATILRSTDAGRHWTLLMQDQRADNPIFGLVRLPGGAALAVGAFAHAYASVDGIAWHPARIDAGDEDPHFNALLPLDGAGLLLLGESALAMRSDDAGGHWRVLKMPVQGSLFGGLDMGGGRLLAFGLHGHVVASGDGGATWRVVAPVTESELLGGAVLHDGGAVLVGRGGAVVVVDSDLRAAHALPVAARTNFADAVQTGGGTVLAAGEGGIAALDMPAAAP